MMRIAREGRLPVLGMLAVALTVTLLVGWGMAFPLYAAIVFLILVFRQPFRPGQASPLAALSPVDGRVLSVDLCRDPYCARPAQCVRLLQEAFGPYGLYAPIEGKLTKVLRGEQTHDDHQVALKVRTDEGDDIVLAIHRARTQGYLRCQVYAGERVGHGSRFGFAGFGRTLDLYLPETSRIVITPGERLHAGQIIGKLRAPMLPESVLAVQS